LTPLLDVVLQLLMFFMMCVNFVNEQINSDIHLPESQSAKPMDKAETEVLFLNIRPFNVKAFADFSEAYKDRLSAKFKPGDVCVLLNRATEDKDKDKDDQALPATANELKFWLKQQAEDSKKKSGTLDVKTAIILRADADTEYAHIYQVLNICKGQGFKTLKLRATTKNRPVE